MHLMSRIAMPNDGGGPQIANLVRSDNGSVAAILISEENA